jgi:muconolactone delta-isomerase
MQFMVSFHYPPGTDRAAIGQLVPAEQARVGELRRQGVIDNLYLSADRQRGWLVFNAADATALDELLHSLPLHPFMQTDIAELRVVEGV